MKIKTLCLMLLLVIGQSMVLFSQDPIPAEPQGEGTELTPYLIASLENLYWIAVQTRDGNSFTGAFFLQTQDINAAVTVNWFEGQGWLPMGIWAAFPFSGTYDGGGNTISNLYIDRPNEEDVSLFGYVVGATIGHLGLIDVSIQGDNLVGGITGETINSGINNCFVSGSVEGNWGVGGIAGSLINAALNNSYNLSSVSGSEHVGGLVGSGQVLFNNTNISIVNSYSAGSIHVLEVGKSASEPQQEGSTARTIRYNLSDRYSKADPPIGGVLGGIYVDGELTDATVTIIDSFWDVDKDGIVGTASGDDNFGATGKTTEEMMTSGTYSSWAITEDENIEKGYPFLAWEYNQGAEKNQHVWIIGTDTGTDPDPGDPGDPVAVPLANTALFIGFLLIGGLVFFRTYRMS